MACYASPRHAPFTSALLALALASCMSAQSSSGTDPGPGPRGATEGGGPGGERTEPRIDDSVEPETAVVGDLAERRLEVTLPLSGSPLGGSGAPVPILLTRREASTTATCATKVETRFEEDETPTVLVVELESDPARASDEVPEDDLERPSFSLRETFLFDCKPSVVVVAATELTTGHRIAVTVSVYSPDASVTATSPLFKALNTRDGTKAVTLEPKTY